MSKPTLVLVTPALAGANNGNWQTAQRWARFLGRNYRVRLVDAWAGDDAQAAPALMIALHARRSAASIAAWRAAHPKRPLVVVLTGTDLYRDIHTDAAAQASLRSADRLVVLNDLGLDALPASLRSKGRVLLQSVPARQPSSKQSIKPARWMRALMVGHLREEKSPQTYFQAARLLQHRDDIRLDHIGGGLDAGLAADALALMQTAPRYRWLGALPHSATQRRIQAAHVLVHASRMEGGAHVVIEAVVSGTPVLASRIAGNLGLLGAGYSGVFDWGDATALAALLERCRDDPAMLPSLKAQCDQRAPLFDPAHERDALLALLQDLLQELLQERLPAPTQGHP